MKKEKKMAWTGKLYQDKNGDIPKDLLAFFVGLMPEGDFSPDLPESVLTPAESKRLQVNLGYLCDRGLASLTSGIFEKLKLEEDLYELRMTKSTHNPPFVVTTLVPQRFVISIPSPFFCSSATQLKLWADALLAVTPPRPVSVSTCLRVSFYPQF
ncbi:MAG: hypothetical protein SXA11_01365 [Cyanobacteriota bacterium]|nr:hypothetical protein [Cyanobacteriota bacterium]